MEQSEKVFSPIVTNECGKSIDDTADLKNAPLLISFNEFPNVTDWRLLQLANASSPMLTSEFGRGNAEMELPAKAFAPISLIPSLRETDANDLQSAKAPAPTFVNEPGRLMLLIPVSLIIPAPIDFNEFPNDNSFKLLQPAKATSSMT